MEIYLHFNRNSSRERLKITFIARIISSMLALLSITLQSSGIRVRNVSIVSFISPPTFLFCLFFRVWK